MTAYLSILSLVVLVGTIALGFAKKLNVGILSFGFALVMGIASGMTQEQIIAGFGSNLFVILLGSMFLFGIAQLNGTLDLLAQKTVAISGKATWSVPLFMYFLGFLISAMGPGTLPGFSIVTMFGVPLAFAMNADPCLLCLIGQMGAIGGGIVPWASTGVVAVNLAAAAGYTKNIAVPLFINTLLGTVFISIFLYILYKGYKIKGDNPYKLKDLPKFNKNQRLTLLGIFALVMVVMVFQTNIGLTSFFIACVLILMGVEDMNACVNAVSWNILLLVSGIGMLMNVVIVSGGIDLLATGLSSVMNSTTAVFFLSLVSSVMGWFCSTVGVVMPTMIPTIPTILENLGQNSIAPAMMISAVVIGSSCAGMSPVTTGGSLIIASITKHEKASTYDTDKLFVRLFLTSLATAAMVALFALAGGYRFTPYS